MKMYKMVLGKDERYWSFHNSILPNRVTNKYEYNLGINKQSGIGLYFFENKKDVANWIKYLLEDSYISNSIKEFINMNAKDMDMYLVEAEVKKSNINKKGIKDSYKIPYFLVKEANITNISKL